MGTHKVLELLKSASTKVTISRKSNLKVFKALNRIVTVLFEKACDSGKVKEKKTQPSTKPQESEKRLKMLPLFDNGI